MLLLIMFLTALAYGSALWLVMAVLAGNFVGMFWCGLLTMVFGVAAKVLFNHMTT